MNTYTQLKSGAWGVRCSGAVSAGATVTVTKKSGESKSEQIAKVLWSGPDNRTGETVSICAIASSGSGGGSSNGARRSYGGRSRGAGSAAPVRGYSSYCTGRDDCGCYDCAS